MDDADHEVEILPISSVMEDYRVLSSWQVAIVFIYQA